MRFLGTLTHIGEIDALPPLSSGRGTRKRFSRERTAWWCQRHLFLVANLVTTSKAPVTTSVALVTTSVALVPEPFNAVNPRNSELRSRRSRTHLAAPSDIKP